MRCAKEPHSIDREGQRKPRGCQPEGLRIDERGRGDEDKETRHRKAAHEGQAQKVAIVSSRFWCLPTGCLPKSLPCRGRQRFAPEPKRVIIRLRAAASASTPKIDRHPATASKPAPGQRRQHRRDRNDQHDRRHQPRRLCPVYISRMIARGTTMTAAPPSPCTKRPAISPCDRSGQNADQRAQQKDRQPGIKRRFAARLICPWPIDQLRQPEGDEIGGDRALHARARWPQDRPRSPAWRADTCRSQTARPPKAAPESRQGAG